MVIVSILVLLVAILVPSLSNAMMLAQRAGCANNLREISRACTNYGTSPLYHRGSTPNSMPVATVDGTNWASFAAETGNAACLWVLIKQNFVGTGSFLCPAASSQGFSAPAQSTGYFTHTTLSYSYLSMVDIPGLDSWKKSNLTELGGGVVLAADRNPRCNGTSTFDTSMDGKNSKNHKQTGQNCALIGGSVTWYEKTSVNGDDIYISGNGNTNPERKDLNDQLVIP
ncbi:MAG TPA: hypothetical protein DCX07_04650 [Phycisphaerales bacterium]|nr:hypothetical protein [Phycisphaerales bacterium]